MGRVDRGAKDGRTRFTLKVITKGLLLDQRIWDMQLELFGAFRRRHLMQLVADISCFDLERKRQSNLQGSNATKDKV